MEIGSTVFVDRKVSDVCPERDTKVRITGTVVNRKDDVFFVDDGTGSVMVSPMGNACFDVVSGQMVRVFGRVRPNGTSYDVIAEIVQDMSGLNVKLYNAVDGYWKEIA